MYLQTCQRRLNSETAHSQMHLSTTAIVSKSCKFDFIPLYIGVILLFGNRVACLAKNGKCLHVVLIAGLRPVLINAASSTTLKTYLLLSGQKFILSLMSLQFPIRGGFSRSRATGLLPTRRITKFRKSCDQHSKSSNRTFSK